MISEDCVYERKCCDGCYSWKFSMLIVEIGLKEFIVSVFSGL